MLYNFTDNTSIGYAHEIQSDKRENIVRGFQLSKSSQIGAHSVGSISSQAYAITIIRIK